MDIDALIAAATEIDRNADLQESRARRFSELAAMARTVEPNSPEHRRIQTESRELSHVVVDFGDDGGMDADNPSRLSHAER